ncbi:hypothetical protein EK904_009354 [Melospiza melodia maxima]|nr:hypothetical protein EK904_009354 [Melospiza melodia maxima]
MLPPPHSLNASSRLNDQCEPSEEAKKINHVPGWATTISLPVRLRLDCFSATSLQGFGGIAQRSLLTLYFAREKILLPAFERIKEQNNAE